MDKNFDIVIIGKGPAGISAALYAKRGGANVAIISQGTSALEKADKIENFYGTTPSIEAKTLLENGYAQAKALEIPIIEKEVVSVEWTGDFMVKTDQEIYTSKSVVLAIGSARKAPNIKGLKQFEGSGVSYCAVCDAFFYRGKTVGILGNGKFAQNELETLTPMTTKRYVLTNGLPAEIEFENATIITTPIAEIVGNTKVEKVLFSDGTNIELDGVFVAMGQAGADSFAKKLGIATENGHLAPNADMSTNLPGLFSAGDCNGGWLQICKAVYEGGLAGTSSLKFIRKK